MRKKIFLGVLLLLALLLSIAFFLKPSPRYEIVYHAVDKNITESMTKVRPEKIETFYIASNNYTIYFYKYYFSSEKDLHEYRNELIDISNASFEEVKIGDYSGLIGKNGGIGLIFEKGNILLMITIKDLERDRGAVEWFLRRHF